jgi:hypothetical protein
MSFESSFLRLAPPAIFRSLSTLSSSCEAGNVRFSGLLKVLTKCFFTASNQIVNDLRTHPATSKYRKLWQASKLVSAAKCPYRGNRDQDKL